MSGLIIGSSGIQLPSRIHRTRNRAGSEQKGRSRGARGMEGDGSLQLVSMVGGRGIWFNVPMTLLSGADNRHGWHKGTVVKFQLTKSDPKNLELDPIVVIEARGFFYSFFNGLLYIYLFIYSAKEKLEIQENRIGKIFINS